jgi:NAD-dependent deacetylase
MFGSGNVVVVTGAGISAASGLRTYRGSGGLWTDDGVSAMSKATAAYFIRNPEASWAWHLARRTEAQAATPNGAHRALATLETHLGDRFTLVTQNIDRLHSRAGNTPARTIEVHGYLDGMRCTAGCAGILPIPDGFNDWTGQDRIEQCHRDLLICPECGFATRPHVLWFDEFYDEVNYRMKSAGRAAAHASLCITIGTSGGVPLAPRIAGIAARAGAVLIDINPDDSELRHLALSTRYGTALAAPALEAVPGLVTLLAGTVGDAFRAVGAGPFGDAERAGVGARRTRRRTPSS